MVDGRQCYLLEPTTISQVIFGKHDISICAIHGNIGGMKISIMFWS